MHLNHATSCELQKIIFSICTSVTLYVSFHLKAHNQSLPIEYSNALARPFWYTTSNSPKNLILLQKQDIFLSFVRMCDQWKSYTYFCTFQIVTIIIEVIVTVMEVIEAAIKSDTMSAFSAKLEKSPKIKPTAALIGIVIFQLQGASGGCTTLEFKIAEQLKNWTHRLNSWFEI